jgi:hypothetical protein
VLILKIVKVLCFDTLLQVLILKGVRSKHSSWTKLALLLVARCSGAVCGEDGLLLGDDLVAEKKKRERAPAGKAQILTRLMIAEGLRLVKGRIKRWTCNVVRSMLAV